uniref:RING-type domain-containing protein n=1 Tax=Branchiostoma floridae TaxID=7739 RepID=C3ZUQ7_BRAFL|eukprot:XP_002587758.1 hypothetical protein BRAFLDRAFT_94662 [Branchiostoma floridae]
MEEKGTLNNPMAFLSVWCSLLMIAFFDRLPEDVMPIRKMTEQDLETTAECSICLEEYEVNEKVLQLACGHQFHVACHNLVKQDDIDDSGVFDESDDTTDDASDIEAAVFRAMKASPESTLGTKHLPSRPRGTSHIHSRPRVNKNFHPRPRGTKHLHSQPRGKKHIHSRPKGKTSPQPTQGGKISTADPGGGGGKPLHSRPRGKTSPQPTQGKNISTADPGEKHLHSRPRGENISTADPGGKHLHSRPRGGGETSPQPTQGKTSSQPTQGAKHLHSRPRGHLSNSIPPEEIYQPFIDKIVTNLEERFPGIEQLTAFNVFAPDEAGHDHTQRLKSVQTHFTVSLTDSLTPTLTIANRPSSQESRRLTIEQWSSAFLIFQFIYIQQHPPNTAHTSSRIYI